MQGKNAADLAFFLNKDLGNSSRKLIIKNY